MIHLLSLVKVIDNSGGDFARCIKILKPVGKKYAQAGDLILVSIYSLKGTNGSLSKGDVFKALVLQTKKNTFGSITSRGDQNTVCLVKVQAKTGEYIPIGSRFKGPISATLQHQPKYEKITSISKATI